MIVVIDYGIGNVGSVVNALDKLGVESKISSDPRVIKKARGIILPGVGNAKQGMENLKKKKLWEQQHMEKRLQALLEKTIFLVFSSTRKKAGRQVSPCLKTF